MRITSRGRVGKEAFCGLNGWNERVNQIVVGWGWGWGWGESLRGPKVPISTGQLQHHLLRGPATRPPFKHLAIWPGQVGNYSISFPGYHWNFVAISVKCNNIDVTQSAFGCTGLDNFNHRKRTKSSPWKLGEETVGWNEPRALLFIGPLQEPQVGQPI